MRWQKPRDRLQAAGGAALLVADAPLPSSAVIDGVRIAFVISHARCVKGEREAIAIIGSIAPSAFIAGKENRRDGENSASMTDERGPGHMPPCGADSEARRLREAHR